MIEAEQIAVLRRDITRSLVEQEEGLRRVCLHASVHPLDDAQLPLALEAWQCGARTLIGLTKPPGPDPVLLEPLERLGDALDDVRELLTREGVG